MKRALLAVSDRTGIVEFARGLAGCGFEIVATDGTHALLAKEGVAAKTVAEVTGLPEMLDGRVKTLHPAIFAGILARRDIGDHMDQLDEHGFLAFDVIAVNLYPFAETRRSGAPHADIVEKIDIGGPSLIRAAGKNSGSVAVVVSPRQYDAVLAEIRSSGEVGADTRTRLCAEAFAHVAVYDIEIAEYLASQQGGGEPPEFFGVGGDRIASLRYGENPHQRGALYSAGAGSGVAHATLLQGAGLSFTNWLDVDAAWDLVSDFDQPASCVIKHTNPCGFAVGADIAGAYRRAYECDSRAAFGGIVGMNRELDVAAVEALGKTFLEAVICPSISDEAASLLSSRERLRILVVGPKQDRSQYDVRSVDGGILVQTRDTTAMENLQRHSLTDRELTDAEWDDLKTAWRLCRHVKSNAVVVVKHGMAVGVGAGQMSRVEAAELAVARAGDRAIGACAASDAFFPMPDGLEVLGRAGIVAVAQPGGSKKDEEVTLAAQKLEMAMVHTGERHFRH